MAGRKVTFLDDYILAPADGSTAFSPIAIQMAGESNYISLAHDKLHELTKDCLKVLMCTACIDSDSKGTLLLKRPIFCLDPMQYLLCKGHHQTLSHPSMATVAQTSLGASIATLAIFYKCNNALYPRRFLYISGAFVKYLSARNVARRLSMGY